MSLITYTFFALGIGLLWASALSSLLYLRGTNHHAALRFAATSSLAAALCLAATLAARFAQWHVVPLTTGTDSIMLFIVMAALTAAAVVQQERFRALLLFYALPLAVLGTLCAVLARHDFTKAPSAINASQTLLFAHVALAFQAYALFLIASLTSLAYVFQARRLKLRRTTGVFQKLPALEDLDRTLYLLVLFGYPMFVITLVLGLVWAWANPNPLSPTWWYSPKILLSALMVLFYAASFHSRSLGLLRGPKLAYFVFVGFAVLLGFYLVLETLRMTNYNFWGAA